jgi:hypothetical protein
MNSTATNPEPVLLIIADISGYTRYMTANAKTLAHSQTIITELIHALVHEIELPLEIAKLEGDAIFLYCRKNSVTQPWTEARCVIAERLLKFFRQFSSRLSELSDSTTCTCNACTHIEKLQLKVVVHSGEALFHRVLNFTELAGVDVIAVHRLLKNSVNAEQYLLVTETAALDLEFPESLQFNPGSETYNDLGRIGTRVHLPTGGSAPVLPPRSFSQSWELFRKLWFAPLAKQATPFHHVSNNVSGAARICYALFTIVFTPFFLPAGAASAWLHSRKPHRHLTDGSCWLPK